MCNLVAVSFRLNEGYVKSIKRFNISYSWTANTIKCCPPSNIIIIPTLTKCQFDQMNTNQLIIDCEYFHLYILMCASLSASKMHKNFLTIIIACRDNVFGAGFNIASNIMITYVNISAMNCRGQTANAQVYIASPQS